MKSTYSVTEAQARLPSLVREAENGPVTISRHDKTVAYIISQKRMDAITETLEILANPEAMKSLQLSRDERLTYTRLDEIETD